MRPFQSLIVWQKSHALTLEVYRVTGRFPAHEQYGLTSQMRRSCSSIPMNIAEGSHRRTPAEFVHFLSIALGSAAPSKKPNVLFIAVDDLRPELGCYGRDYIKSPNIDRIARAGMTFGRAYCQQAVCSPSRSSLLTGTRPDTTKVWDLVTHFRNAIPDVVTLPEHFKQNGYFVQGMGKIYHPGYDDPRSWSVPWKTAPAPTYALLKTPEVKDEDAPVPRGEKKKPGPPFESADVPDDFYRDGKVANMAVEAGSETGIFAADAAVERYLDGRARTPWTAERSDEDATFRQRLDIDLGALEPLVALPHLPCRNARNRCNSARPSVHIRYGSGKDEPSTCSVSSRLAAMNSRLASSIA